MYTVQCTLFSFKHDNMYTEQGVPLNMIICKLYTGCSFKHDNMYTVHWTVFTFKHDNMYTEQGVRLNLIICTLYKVFIQT